MTRIGYRIIRAANQVGVRKIEGEEKHLREFQCGDLFEPSRLVAALRLRGSALLTMADKFSKSIGTARAHSTSFISKRQSNGSARWLARCPD
ncbi:hypothetical protein CQ14_02065 [Bradyrhizobium lablabi]|uniref:Uncharacterized protein n=1 Tax=Bradyrhizobium lablabi TaxID=722472 RepID=A0A0R3N957_9BRAD|nr:hypothetical protein [Bradyrhizobium lablabi]KRR26320.1 hypothetical protein CQ14_02065 [Bradyrhizobium lablabi]